LQSQKVCANFVPTGIRHTLAHTICVHELYTLVLSPPLPHFCTLPLVQVVGQNDSGNGWFRTAEPTCTFRVNNDTHGPSKTTLSQCVATSTALGMGGAAHARTSNTWKTDKHTLGCHEGGGQTDHTRSSDTGGGVDNTCPKINHTISPHDHIPPPFIPDLTSYLTDVHTHTPHLQPGYTPARSDLPPSSHPPPIKEQFNESLILLSASR